MILILDIDHTLSDASTRNNIAGQEPDRADKVSYQRWLDLLQSHASLLEDEPVHTICELANTMHDAGHKIYYLTGRAEQFRLATERWISRNSLPDAPLIHRADDDWRSGGAYKIEHILNIQKMHPGEHVLVLDDDPDDSLRKELERHGITLAKIFSHTGDRNVVPQTRE